jgi:hypothetical protein
LGTRKERSHRRVYHNGMGDIRSMSATLYGDERSPAAKPGSEEFTHLQRYRIVMGAVYYQSRAVDLRNAPREVISFH